MAWFTPLNSSCRVVFHIQPPKAGTITFNGANYSTGDNIVVANGTYSISANAVPGYQFDHWQTGGRINVSDEYSPITTANVNGNGVIMAWFTPLNSSYRISFAIHPPNSGTITFDGKEYGNGDSIKISSGTYSISANAEPGYKFDHWQTGGKITISDENSATTTVTINGNGVIIAWFTFGEKMTVNTPSYHKVIIKPVPVH